MRPRGFAAVPMRTASVSRVRNVLVTRRTRVRTMVRPPRISGPATISPPSRGCSTTPPPARRVARCSTAGSPVFQARTPVPLDVNARAGPLMNLAVELTSRGADHGGVGAGHWGGDEQRDGGEDGGAHCSRERVRRLSVAVN